jgi:hypothetical protein
MKWSTLSYSAPSAPAGDLILLVRPPGLFCRTILPFPERSTDRGDGQNPVPHPQIICRNAELPAIASLPPSSFGPRFGYGKQQNPFPRLNSRRLQRVNCFN